MQVINLARERRRRQGRKPQLDLIGTRSDLKSVLDKAMAAADESERAELLRAVAFGSYSELIRALVTRFEIPELEETRAIG